MSFGNSDDFGGLRPAPKKSNALWWILGILAAVTIGGTLLCCGGFYYMFSFGSQMIATETKRLISTDPTIQEHIGDIKEMSFNFSATGAAGGGETLVFDVNGENGSGQIQVVVNNQQGAGPTISSCTLILPNGERHEIELVEPSAEPAPPKTVDPAETSEVEAEGPQPTQEALPAEDTEPAAAT